MKIEQQVCSLELSKKLKELGVKQDGLWVWVEADELTQEEGWFVRLSHSYGEKLDPNPNSVSAFTVSELGDMLPRKLNSKTISDWFLKFYQHQDGDWLCEYIDQPPYRNVQIQEYAHTEADARANMLIYLIENSLIGLPS